MQAGELTTPELMQHALYWCRRNETIGNEFIKIYYERYMLEKHGFTRSRLPSLDEFNAMSVLAQRTLVEKWRALRDVVDFELRFEKFNFQASTLVLNGTRGAILTGMSFKADNMSHNLLELTSRSESAHVILANVIMKRRKPEARIVPTAEIVKEHKYWHDSATCFVERPLTRELARRARDSEWQYGELKQLLMSEHLLAFLCGTRDGSVSRVKLLKAELLVLVVSFFLGCD